MGKLTPPSPTIRTSAQPDSPPEVPVTDLSPAGPSGDNLQHNSPSPDSNRKIRSISPPALITGQSANQFYGSRALSKTSLDPSPSVLNIIGDRSGRPNPSTRRRYRLGRTHNTIQTSTVGIPVCFSLKLLEAVQGPPFHPPPTTEVFTVCTSGSGEDWKLGLGWDKPKVHGLHHDALITNVVASSIRSMHCLTLTLEGTIYSWAVNDDHELGRDPGIHEPQNRHDLELQMIMRQV